jgi:hypothetical protein
LLATAEAIKELFASANNQFIASVGILLGYLGIRGSTQNGIMEGTWQGNSFNQFYFPWNFATHQ